MILYTPNTINLAKKKDRPIKTLKVMIDELPEKPKYFLNNDRERVKFIKTIETLVRKSDEYKTFIKFLKDNMDMRKCTVLRNLKDTNVKGYSIEIHHTPFNLYSIVDIVMNKRQSVGEEMNPFMIADEVMMLHYEGTVGLIPLSKTMHELVHSDKIFIPLQLVYQKYDIFFDEYEEFMNDNHKAALNMQVELSLKQGEIMSDSLDPEFVYVEVDGFRFPEIDPNWANVFNKLTNIDLTEQETFPPEALPQLIE